MKILAPVRRSLHALSRRVAVPVPFQNHLDMPMVQLSSMGDILHARDLFEGVQIMGGTGSGKSSASGKALAHAMLSANWGGLVLCAKPDEASRWMRYLHDTGRTAHLVHVTPHGGFNINFPDYEIHRPDRAGADTYNLVALMEVMMDASAAALGSAAGGEGAPFWILSRRELLANAIEPLIAATGRFRLDELMRMVASAPQSHSEAFSDEWKARSFCYQILRKAYDAPIGAPLPVHAHQAGADYWFSTFASLDPKTRSNIVATLTSAISPFLRGVLHDRFCTNTNIIPEMTHEGAVIVWDFPVKVFGAAAVVASQLIKYQWQKAMERRPVGPNTRPCFLFADECQFYLSEYDAEFQSTARSAMAATVYITQNLPTYYAQLRARDPKAKADSLLGNFQTKIFHANTDPTTNQYAADLIGRSIQRRFSDNWSASHTDQVSETLSKNWGLQHGKSVGSNTGMNTGVSSSRDQRGNYSTSVSYGNSSGRQDGESWSRSGGSGYSYGDSRSDANTAGGGWSEQMDYTVQPADFAARLRKGGAGGLVDGILVQGGRRFNATGAHWLPCTFKQ